MCEADDKKSRSESDSDSAGPSTRTRTRKPCCKKEVPLKKKVLKSKAEPVSPNCSGQTQDQPEQTPHSPRKRSRSSSSETPRYEGPSPQKEELCVENRKRWSSDSCEESKGGAKKCRSESSSNSAGPSTSRTTGTSRTTRRTRTHRSKAKPVSPNCRGQTQEQPEQTPDAQRSRSSSSERPSQEVPGPSEEESSEDEELYKLFSSPSFKNKYNIKKTRKTGGRAPVYLGIRREDNLPVAIKRIPLDSILLKDVPYHESQVPQEVDMLVRLGAWPNAEEHPVTPVLLEWFQVSGSVLLVLERPEPCMDLVDHLNTLEFGMTEEEVKPLFRQLVNVTIDMMSRGVFHRDIKPGNILLDWKKNKAHPRVRLIDFGCSTIMNPDCFYRCPQGTLMFMAPEVLRGRYQAYPSTVWQLGSVLYMMLHNNFPFMAKDYIFNNKPRICDGLSRGCKNLLNRMMDKNPFTRITMEEIQDHPWLRERPRAGLLENLRNGPYVTIREGLMDRMRRGEEGGTQGKTQAEGGDLESDPLFLPMDSVDLRREG